MTKTRKTFEELLAEQKKTRKEPAHREHDIQSSCVLYFRLQYPQYRLNLFAVPNGTYKKAVAQRIFKEEGLLSGVSDLILLLPKGIYHGLLIEMKAEKGKQSPTQKQWQQHIEQFGYKYVVCYSLDDFIKEIKMYLNNE